MTEGAEMAPVNVAFSWKCQTVSNYALILKTGSVMYIYTSMLPSVMEWLLCVLLYTSAVTSFSTN